MHYFLFVKSDYWLSASPISRCIGNHLLLW